MLIREIMSANVTVIRPSTSVLEAARLMRRHDVGALPVVEEGSVVGIVTDRDIVARSTAEGQNPDTQPISEVMSDDVAHIFDDQDMQEAAWLMEIKGVRRLAVLDSSHRLVGIISLTDLSRHGHHELSGEVLGKVSAGERTAASFGGPSSGGHGWTYSRL